MSPRLATAAAGILACVCFLALPQGGAAQEGAAPLNPAAPAPAAVPIPTSPSAQTPPKPGDLAYGAFQRGYYLTALKLAEPLANLGDPAAQTLLGEIYSRGLGVRRDEAEAARWYKAAAQAGSAEGQFRYALLLLDGKVVEEDMAQARDLMKAAAEAGNPQAQFNYGQMLIQASPTSGFAEARTYFEASAKAGVADAQYAMAQFLAYGHGVEAPDEAAARRWLRAAAIRGHDTAQIELGIWMVNGRGAPADARQGFLWLKHAAERGNPIAINRVAHLYKDGIGVAPDKAEAAKWYVLSRRANNTDPVLEDFFHGLGDDERKAALEAANRFRLG